MPAALDRLNIAASPLPWRPEDVAMKRNERQAGHGPASGGFVTVGTLIVAAVSALVLTSNCHALAAAVAAAALFPGAAVASLDDGLADPMAPLRPFDEHFYTPTVTADGDDANCIAVGRPGAQESTP
jgi:hypothetical protein